jgi:hypothetical protein
MIRFATLIAIATLPSLVFAVGAGDEWLSPSDPRPGSYTSVPPAKWREVSPSYRSGFERLLNAEAFISLGPSQAESLGVNDLICRNDERLFLVRAVSENRGTGSFELKRKDGDLFVTHGSLGREGAREKSAIVVCLPSAPSRVYAATVGAL